MNIEITRITSADYAHARKAYVLLNRAREVDLPGFPPLPEVTFRVGLDTPWPGRMEERYLATLDGEPAGVLELVMPMRENRDNVYLDLSVEPKVRRRGVGTALLRFAMDRARELGRGRIAGMSAAPVPGSGDPGDPAPPAFAARFDFTPALTEVRRVLDLDRLDQPALDEMLAQAWSRADGYRLVQWRGSVPDELLSDVAYLDGRLSQDAPMGDMVVQPVIPDAARISEVDQVIELWQRRPYHTGLADAASGRLVAWTTICAEAEVDWHAWQQVTVVDPEHRGHRLGLIAKIENLRFFMSAEPAVRQIGTFNAASNNFMININEMMGFRPVHAFENWQREL